MKWIFIGVLVATTIAAGIVVGLTYLIPMSQGVALLLGVLFGYAGGTIGVLWGMDKQDRSRW